MTIQLTWQLEKQPLCCSTVCLYVFAVLRPVEVGDETRAAATLANLFVFLSHGVDVNKVVVGSDGQMSSIGRIFHLVDHLFPIFYVNHFL